jgi:hypothetical protein
MIMIAERCGIDNAPMNRKGTVSCGERLSLETG